MLVWYSKALEASAAASWTLVRPNGLCRSVMSMVKGWDCTKPTTDCRDDRDDKYPQMGADPSERTTRPSSCSRPKGCVFPEETGTNEYSIHDYPLRSEMRTNVNHLGVGICALNSSKFKFYDSITRTPFRININRREVW